MWPLAAPASDKLRIHASASVGQNSGYSSVSPQSVLMNVQPFAVSQKERSKQSLDANFDSMRQNTFDLSVELDALMSLPISTFAMVQAKSHEWSQESKPSKSTDIPGLAQLDSLWVGGSSPDKIDYFISVVSHAMAQSSPESHASLQALARYLKKQAHHPQTPLLLSELSSFFTLLTQSKSTELIRNTLAIFPPKNRDDFKCVEGTRARLMEALTFFQRESGCRQGIEGEFKAKLASGLDEVAQQVYVTEQLGNKVGKDLDVHIMPYLYQLAGVSKQTVEQKDSNALLPSRFFTAQEADRISHQLRKTQTSALQQAKNILQSQMEDFFQGISKNDFSGSQFHEVTNHSLVQLLQGYQPDFDIASEKYLSENPETGGYSWNTQEIFNDIKNILKTHLLSDHVNPSLKDRKYFSSHDASAAMTALLSSHINQKEQAFHLLSLLSDNVQENSPSLFMHILIKSAEKSIGNSYMNLTEDEKTQGVFQLLESLKNEVKTQLHLSETLSNLSARWKKIAGCSESPSQEIKAYWDEQKNNPEAIFNKDKREKLDRILLSKLYPSTTSVFISHFIYFFPQNFLSKTDQEKEKQLERV